PLPRPWAMARRPRLVLGPPRWTRAAVRIHALRLRLGDAIADAVHGLDEARPRGVRLELAADVLDVRVDGALVALEGHAVHRVEKLGAGEDAAGLSGHRHEDLELGRGQVHRAARDRGPQPRRVEKELADLEVLARLDRPLAPAQHRADACDQLARAERLGDL